MSIGAKRVELQLIGIQCPLELLRMKVTWHCRQDTHISKTLPHGY